jgi:hypothetical protein
VSRRYIGKAGGDYGEWHVEQVENGYHASLSRLPLALRRSALKVGD